MVELAIRYEHRGLGAIIFVTDVQELDPRGLPREALEGQLDVREALKLDLQPEAFFESCRALGLASGGCIVLERLELSSQRSTMAGTVARWDDRAASALLGGLVALRGRDPIEDEVAPSFVGPIGHA